MRQVVDWNTMDIDWQGRGWDRGLRGIAFHDETVYIAASDELFAYTPDFELIDDMLQVSDRDAFLCARELAAAEAYIRERGAPIMVKADGLIRIAAPVEGLDKGDAVAVELF